MPCHNIAKSLTQSTKKIYRYTISLRNPFPGSIFSEVLGHHFVDLVYMFMTLLERFPRERQRLASVDFARYWITFANGLPPWPAFTLEDGEKIAVADSREGWVLRTRQEDVERSRDDEGGERRYHQWEVLADILENVGEDAQNVVEALSFPNLTALAG